MQHFLWEWNLQCQCSVPLLPDNLNPWWFLLHQVTQQASKEGSCETWNIMADKIKSVEFVASFICCVSQYPVGWSLHQRLRKVSLSCLFVWLTDFSAFMSNPDQDKWWYEGHTGQSNHSNLINILLHRNGLLCNIGEGQNFRMDVISYITSNSLLLFVLLRLQYIYIYVLCAK